MTSSHSNHPSSKYARNNNNNNSREARPLIDQVTNSWRGSEKDRDFDSSDDEDDYQEVPHCCDLDSDSSFVNLGYAFLTSRKVRRAMFVFVLGFLAVYILIKNLIYPAWRERQELLEGISSPYVFGNQMPDKLDDIIQVQNLHPSYIPGGESDPEGTRRLIFIGDIHGCKDELLKLLDTVGFDKENDKIIATGDVVAKGPDSPGVIDALIKFDALSVRGNHEDRILLAAKSRLSAGATPESEDNLPADATAERKGAGLKGEALLDYLKHRHLTYLRSLPLIIHIPAIIPPSHPPTDLSSAKKHKKKKQFDLLHDINVVHAGLVPSVPLSRQDPFSVMNMRSMSPSNHVPSENRKRGIPWERVWGWYNDRISRSRRPFLSWLLGRATESSEASAWWNSWNGLYGGSNSDDAGDDAGAVRKHEQPSVVVYGHDSPRGLNLKAWSKGLDSGCVNGDRLTALVLDAWGRAEIVSVSCKDRK